MKVQSVQWGYAGRINQNQPGDRNISLSHKAQGKLYAANPLAHDTVSFGARGMGNLPELLRCQLRCMYSGILLINPNHIKNLERSGVLSKSLETVIKALAPSEQSFYRVEKEVFLILKNLSKNIPGKNVRDTMQIIRPGHIDDLHRSQRPIFEALAEKAKGLDVHSQNAFDSLMYMESKKLNEMPIYIPFSRREFTYRLGKAVNGTEHPQLMKELTEIVYSAPHYRDPEAPVKQHIALKKIEKMLGDRFDSRALKNLLGDAYRRIRGEKQVISFSRKSFIYDLGKKLQNCTDSTLKEEMLAIARQLPTSNESASAWIVKNANDSSDRIAMRIITPSMATIEHIRPRSKNGPDQIYNYGWVSQKWNSNIRGDIDFAEFLLAYPEIEPNIYKYFCHLIELNNQGVFHKLKIPEDYIPNLKNTIEKESQGLMNISLDGFRWSGDKYDIC